MTLHARAFIPIVAGIISRSPRRGASRILSSRLTVPAATHGLAFLLRRCRLRLGSVQAPWLARRPVRRSLLQRPGRRGVVGTVPVPWRLDVNTA